MKLLTALAVAAFSALFVSTGSAAPCEFADNTTSVSQPLQGQLNPELPGQIVRSLPGQIVGALPGQIVQALPGQMTGSLEGQISCRTGLWRRDLGVLGN